MLDSFKIHADSVLKIVNKPIYCEQFKAGEKSIGFIITAWLSTDVPYYSMILGRLFKERGHKVYFIFDDLNFFDEESQNEILRQTYYNLSNEYNKILLSDSVREEKSGAVDIGKFVKSNEQLINRNYSKNEYEFIEDYLSKSYSSYSKILDELQLSKLVIPGGIYKNTCLLRTMCEQKNIDYLTYDSGDNTMLLGVNSVAAHRIGATTAYEKFNKMNFSDEIKIDIREKALAIMHSTKAGTDFFGYHNGKESSYVKEMDSLNLVVIPLNIFNDAAAVEIDSIFESPREWLIETLDFLLINTEYKIVIRDHPGSVGHYNNIKLIDYLEKKYETFIDSKRLEVLKYFEEINTYTLLEKANLVLPYTSTVGIEAAILGAKVVICTNVYYKNTFFVEEVNNKKDYFTTLISTIETTKDKNLMYQSSLEFYYFSQELGFLKTKFTPQPLNFKEILKDFMEIKKEKNVEIFISAIENLESLEWLLFENLIQEGVARH